MNTRSKGTALITGASSGIGAVYTQIVMTAEDVVNAALEGFAQGEVVTIPSLPNVEDWTAYETARQALIPKLSLSSPAARYGTFRRGRYGNYS